MSQNRLFSGKCLATDFAEFHGWKPRRFPSPRASPRASVSPTICSLVSPTICSFVYSVPSVVAFLSLPLPLCTAIPKRFVFLTRFFAAKKRKEHRDKRLRCFFFATFALHCLNIAHSREDFFITHATSHQSFNARTQGRKPARAKQRKLCVLASWRLCVEFLLAAAAALRSLRQNPPQAVRFFNKKLVIPSKRAIIPVCEHCSLT